MASAANGADGRPTDVGLGIAILLFFLFCLLALGFSIDFFKKIYQKEHTIAIIDGVFLLLFSIPILYVHCQMGGCCDPFCDWIINLSR